MKVCLTISLKWVRQDVQFPYLAIESSTHHPIRICDYLSIYHLHLLKERKFDWIYHLLFLSYIKNIYLYRSKNLMISYLKFMIKVFKEDFVNPYLFNDLIYYLN